MSGVAVRGLATALVCWGVLASPTVAAQVGLGSPGAAGGSGEATVGPVGLERWARVLMQDQSVGHERRTQTALSDGRIISRIEVSWSVPDVAHELVVEEDGEGRVYRFEQRRWVDGVWRRLQATVQREAHAATLRVDAGGLGRHSLPWSDAARGPVALQRERAEISREAPVGRRFEQVEYVLDLGRAVTTRYELMGREEGLARWHAGHAALGKRPLVLWTDAEGAVARSSLSLSQGRRRTQACDELEGRAAARGPMGCVDRRQGALVLPMAGAAPDLSLPAPSGYAWYDWTGDVGSGIRAGACAADGRQLQVDVRSMDPADTLRAAAGNDPLVMVERESPSGSVLVAKDRERECWVLAADRGDLFVRIRSAGDSDAAMAALLELADVLSFVG